jgi:hypothetical protein
MVSCRNSFGHVSVSLLYGRCTEETPAQEKGESNKDTTLQHVTNIQTQKRVPKNGVCQLHTRRVAVHAGSQLRLLILAVQQKSSRVWILLDFIRGKNTLWVGGFALALAAIPQMRLHIQKEISRTRCESEGQPWHGLQCLQCVYQCARSLR